MRKAKLIVREPEMRAEYDFRDGVRGKYAQRYAARTNVILAPDVAAHFPDSRSVNDALRALIAIISRSVRRKARVTTAKKARRV